MPVTEFEGLALDGDSSVCGQMRKSSQTDQRKRMIDNQITPLTARTVAPGAAQSGI